MGKYLDLKVGKKLKVFRFNSGSGQYGKWALFSFTPSEKDDKGNYVYGQEYTIIIDNFNEINYQLQDGMQVEIASINSITAEIVSYKNNKGENVNKTVMKVKVNLKVESFSNQQQQYSNQNSNDFNSYGGGFGGDYEMPNF